MQNRKSWLSRCRGATTTETLFVILFAGLLIGGAVMVFGPTLAKKYTFAAKMLNMEEEPTRTLADGPVREDPGTNPVWYVVFTFGAVGFFGVFVAPMMFPRARRKRQLVILSLAERFPVLTPLVDPDMMADDKLRELRGLADEVNELDKHREGALDIQPHDYGKMALPSEQTVDASFSEMPDLDDILNEAREKYTGKSGANRAPAAGLDLDADPDATQAASGPIPVGDGYEQDETQMAVPLSQRLESIRGDDEIPFNSVSPSAKPQMQPLRKSPPPLTPGDDSTTIDVGTPDELFDNADALAADILRQSSALPAMDDTDDATIIRDSQPLKGVDDTDAETELVKPLDRNKVRSGPLASPDRTTPDKVPGANAPDATTQDFQGYDHD